MKVADKHDSKIILANDPDADRLAIAEKMDGAWKIFNGNQIGALLGKWALDGYKQKLLKEENNFKVNNYMVHAAFINHQPDQLCFSWTTYNGINSPGGTICHHTWSGRTTYVPG